MPEWLESSVFLSEHFSEEGKNSAFLLDKQTYTNIGNDKLDATVQAIYQVFLLSLLL